jgi:hypothetical protein
LQLCFEQNITLIYPHFSDIFFISTVSRYQCVDQRHGGRLGHVVEPQKGVGELRRSRV